MSDDWGNDPIQKAPAAASAAGAWGDDPVVGSKNFKFSDSAISTAMKKPGASVVYMKPDAYLALTPDLPDNAKTDRKGASLKKSLDKGDDVDEVPSIDVTVGKDGTAKVTDQDGRHRALFAKQNGIDLIPVQVQRSGDKAAIKSLAGMQDGSAPIPYDFKPVQAPADQAAAQKSPPGAPRWDVLGDIGRAAENSYGALKNDLKQADAPLKTAGDEARAFGGALKAPVDALGIIASPVTGLVHGAGGSLIAGAIEHGSDPNVIPKSSPFYGDTKGFSDGLTDVVNTIETGKAGAEGASPALAKPSQSANTLKAATKAANLKPGVQVAHDAGYVLPPTAALDSPGVVNDLASGVGGKIKLQQGASTRNQEVTNGLAAKSLGLPKDTVLTDKVFKTVRDNASKAYTDIANSVPQMQADAAYKAGISKLGVGNQAASTQFKGVVENPELDKMVENLGKVDTFSPDSALFVVRKLRKDAGANLQNRADPNKAALGLAQRKAADEIDDLVERNLAAAGKADLVPKYKEARQLLAKSHDVEGATNSATGDVSAKALAKLSNRGSPFTGDLKVIANTANAFPKAMQNAASFGGDEPYSALDAGASVFAAAHGDYGAVATILGRPLVRNALLSKAYQDHLFQNTTIPNIPPPQSGLSLVQSAPLPGVQNQLAKGIFRAAHVNGLRAMTAAQASQQPAQGQQ